MSRDVPEGGGLLTRVSRCPTAREGRPAVRHPRTPYVELRRARVAGPAAGLGRTDTERTGAPSIGSTRISRSERVRPRLLFTHTTSPRTLSLAASLGHLVKGWLVASNYPGSARPAPGCPVTRRSSRERCVSPTSATDYRPEHPTDCPIPGCDLRRAPRPCGSGARRRTRTHLRPMASGVPPGEASLDGEPPASALTQPASIVRVRVAPSATMSVMPRGPGGASIECSSALHLPTAALSTASRACDVASDALCRDPTRADPAFRSERPGDTARRRLRCRLVKDDGFADTRTPSLDECSLPC